MQRCVQRAKLYMPQGLQTMIACWCAQAAARQEELDRQEEEFAKAQDDQEIMAEKVKKKQRKGGRRDPNSFSNPVSMEIETE